MGNFQAFENLLHSIRALRKKELARSPEICSSVDPTSCLAVTSTPFLGPICSESY